MNNKTSPFDDDFTALQLKVPDIPFLSGPTVFLFVSGKKTT